MFVKKSTKKQLTTGRPPIYWPDWLTPKGLDMSLAKKPPGKKTGGKYTAAGLYITVPTLMAAAILIGFFAGQWADERFNTEPYLMLVGLVLGMAAAGRELYRLIKKAQAMDEEEHKKDGE